MAKAGDPFYYYLVSNPEKFWGAFAEAEGQDIFSLEFKDLFQKMTSLKADMRPSLQEILCHPFMMGELPTTDNVI